MDYNKKIDDILNELKGNLEGLSNKEARDRLENMVKIYCHQKKEKVF